MLDKLLIAVIGGLVAGVVTFIIYFLGTSREDTKSLSTVNQKTNSNTSSLDNLTDKVVFKDVCEERTKRIEGKVDTLGGKMNKVNGKMNNLKSEVSEVKGMVSTIYEGNGFDKDDH